MSADDTQHRRDLIAALRSYEQADPDGVMVNNVSRQALEEAAALIESLAVPSIAATTLDAIAAKFRDQVVPGKVDDWQKGANTQAVWCADYVQGLKATLAPSHVAARERCDKCGQFLSCFDGSQPCQQKR